MNEVQTIAHALIKEMEEQGIYRTPSGVLFGCPEMDDEGKVIGPVCLLANNSAKRASHFVPAVYQALALRGIKGAANFVNTSTDEEVFDLLRSL